VIASFGFSVFEIACATGKDLQTVLICRFFSGFFGACPITVSICAFSFTRWVMGADVET
jgi:DHA1 family multidrug resistance protein-like MFS transporter